MTSFQVLTCATHKCDIKPEGEAVHRSGLEDVELVGDVDAMEVRFVGLHEIDDVALSLGKANANVKCVDLKTEKFSFEIIKKPLKYKQISQALTKAKFKLYRMGPK